MLTTTKTVLSAPLPRVFEESANGKAVPVATPAHGPIGGGFQQEELGRISKETVCTDSYLFTSHHNCNCSHDYAALVCLEDCVGVGSHTEGSVGQTSCVCEHSFLCPQNALSLQQHTLTC